MTKISKNKFVIVRENNDNVSYLVAGITIQHVGIMCIPVSHKVCFHDSERYLSPLCCKTYIPVKEIIRIEIE